ncbi:MAG: hypothetical protein J6M62_11345 [Selenomonadaceae bacterium]|nr:hypothetical protein [Selenomonadaceae bacterium]MBP3722264.1 hypothetical protein [Selenomonadaceae bacterium]
MNAYKKLLILFTMLLSLTFSGCFHGDIGITINEDGSVHNKYRFTGNGFMQREINGLRKQFVSKGEIKEIAQGDTRGFEVEYDYPDIESMAKDKDSLANAHKGKNLGVAKKSGWFFDDYRFDFLMEGDGRDTGGMDADISLLLTMTFPEAAKNHNADMVTPDGKILTWNLLTSIITGQDKSMKADFRIYHKDHIILTGCIAFILILLAILLFVKARSASQSAENSGEGESAETKGFAVPLISKALVIIALLIGIFALYSFKSEATFTEADSIAYVAGQETDKASEDKK